MELSSLESTEDVKATRVPALSKAKISELTDAFNVFDVLGKQSVDEIYLKVLLSGLGFSTTTLPPTNSAQIDLDEFLGIMAQKYADVDEDFELKRAFSLLSHSTSTQSRITKDSIHKLLMEFEGEDMSELEVAAMIEEFDADGDGELTLEEFAQVMDEMKSLEAAGL